MLHLHIGMLPAISKISVKMSNHTSARSLNGVQFCHDCNATNHAAIKQTKLCDACCPKEVCDMFHPQIKMPMCKQKLSLKYIFLCRKKSYEWDSAGHPSTGCRQQTTRVADTRLVTLPKQKEQQYLVYIRVNSCRQCREAKFESVSQNTQRTLGFNQEYT